MESSRASAPPEPVDPAIDKPPPEDPLRLRVRAVRISVVYALLAGLWILITDRVLSLLARDTDALLHLSFVKGIAFVAITALLLFGMLWREFNAVRRGFLQLQTAKLQVERLSRLNLALARINHAIARTDTRRELMERACDTLVRHGGFAMAWAGWAEPGASVLTPLARAGRAQDYVHDISVRVDTQPEGLGPSGRAFREGRPIVSNDFLGDPTARPWREQAIRHGLRSSVALPVRERGRVCAVLNVYADSLGFFGDQELALLESAALDLSFALDSLLLEDERLEAERVAARERSFSDAMIDSMPGVLYFYDEQGHFLRWNRNFEVVSGYSGTDIARMHPLAFFPEQERARIERAVREALQQGEIGLEATFLARDGRTVPYYFTGRRVQFDGQPCLVGVGIDISERKRAERALRELNETLEARVAQRTDELRQALALAESADRLKAVFLATISHELRTPLNAIIGFSNLLLQGISGPLNAEQSHQLSSVRDSAHQLLEMINDVLDLARIEAGQLVLGVDAYDLRDAIERSMAMARPLAQGKGLTLDLQLPSVLPMMLGDRRRLEQVLAKLLHNAIRFTERGGVRVEAEIGADRVRIAVIDSGIGVRPEDLPQLFQPFHQLDQGTDRRQQGSGLGLPIAHRLVVAMGGSLGVRSEAGGGSVFTVELPLRPPPAQTQATPSIERPTASATSMPSTPADMMPPA